MFNHNWPVVCHKSEHRFDSRSDPGCFGAFAGCRSPALQARGFFPIRASSSLPHSSSHWFVAAPLSSKGAGGSLHSLARVSRIIRRAPVHFFQHHAVLFEPLCREPSCYCEWEPACDWGEGDPPGVSVPERQPRLRNSAQPIRNRPPRELWEDSRSKDSAMDRSNKG